MLNGKAYFMKLLLLASLLSGFDTSSAEPKTGDGGGAMKKAQGLIRQLSQEKMTLEAEKNAWLNEKNVLADKLKSLEDAVRKLQPLQAEVERYKSGLETVKTGLEAQLDQERHRQQALVQKHNEVVVKAKAIHADNELLVRAVREREQWIEQCGVRNQELHTSNTEILNKYKDKGLLQQLVELEPFTGIGQIETENTVEDYKYKLHQLQITPFRAADEKPKPAPPAGNTLDGVEAKQ